MRRPGQSGRRQGRGGSEGICSGVHSTAGFSIRRSGSIDRPLPEVLGGCACTESGGEQGIHGGYSEEGQQV